MSDDVLARLVATPRSPRRVLDELAAAARELAKYDRPLPEVELHLAGGQVLRGRLAGAGDDAALVVTGGSPKAPTVAWVRVDQIAAITVTDASLFVRPVVPREPAPSKLELARALGARADSLTTALGRALPMTTLGDLDDDGRRAVAAVLPALVDTLRAIARDAMGKQALEPIAGVELGAGTGPELRRDGATLVVLAPRLGSDAWSAAQLRAELEKLL